MANHNERCPKCKCRVFTLLERIYGECEPAYKADIPTKAASEPRCQHTKEPPSTQRSRA